MKEVFDFVWGCILFAPCAVLGAFVLCEFFNFMFN